MSRNEDTPAMGEQAPDFTALCCDGETFRPASLSGVLNERGGVLVFYGFTYSAVAENWWRQYNRRGWDDFSVPVLGLSRDGPYTQNRFLREMDLPFKLFSDINGTVADSFGLLTQRDGMGMAKTARRAIYVLDGDREVRETWIGEDWITPPPIGDIETAIESL
jgi:peroxiredoxin